MSRDFADYPERFHGALKTWQDRVGDNLNEDEASALVALLTAYEHGLLDDQAKRLFAAGVYNAQSMVEEFHDVTDVARFPGIGLVEAIDLRFRLIHEETGEVLMALERLRWHAEATPRRDSKGWQAVAKELADLLYVVYGTADVLGIPLPQVYSRVHASNMTKLGRDGKAIKDEGGKVLKGPNYEEPDMKGLIA